jgi:hypothetical protein
MCADNCISGSPKPHAWLWAVMVSPTNNMSEDLMQSVARTGFDGVRASLDSAVTVQLDCMCLEVEGVQLDFIWTGLCDCAAGVEFLSSVQLDWNSLV